MNTSTRFTSLCLLFICAASGNSFAQFDPTPAWPLCGRITENPPLGWSAEDGCPAERFGNPAYSDEPLSSTFGPRPLASEGNRYDFHRGVDIATPIGTPFFATADGIVRIAGVNSSYSDPLVSVRHFRPGETSCNAGGCYQSYYLHISDWVVSEGETVSKGQLLGYTGESGSGFEHVHFEVRNAPGFDPFSSWQRDAIHPLSVVPYSAPNNTEITFNAVDFSNPNAGVVDLTVVSSRYDLLHVGVSLFDSNLNELLQPGAAPDANGYFVLPPFFDLEDANFTYTHKDSSSVPWESFDVGGMNECPYADDHGPSYNANTHLDAGHPEDNHEGLFNGIHVRTLKYWPSDQRDYEVDVVFEALQGVASCVEATAIFASGDTATGQWGDCSASPNLDPTAAFTFACNDLDCTFDGRASNDPDGNIVSYNWNFGDGGNGSGSQPANSFPFAGDWLVSLSVTDDDGASDEVAQWVSVSEPPPPPDISISLSTNKKRNKVTVLWSGVGGNRVDIYRDGSKASTTRNDGNWGDRNVTKGNTYLYRVCAQNSSTECSGVAEISL